MRVTIEVREMDMRSERTVEVRRVTTQGDRKLTATGASKILRREFPELPSWITASKLENKREFFAHARCVSHRTLYIPLCLEKISPDRRVD